MEKSLQDYFNCFQTLHDRLKGTIDGLSQSGLDWTPGSEMNSLGIIAAHVAGSERFMFGDVLTKQPSGRDRDGEFSTKGINVAGLNELLDGSLEFIHQVLEGFTLDTLDAPIVSPLDGKEYSLRMILFLGLGHVAGHLGHAEITRQMWDQRSKD